MELDVPVGINDAGKHAAEESKVDLNLNMRFILLVAHIWGCCRPGLLTASYCIVLLLLEINTRS